MYNWASQWYFMYIGRKWGCGVISQEVWLLSTFIARPFFFPMALRTHILLFTPIVTLINLWTEVIEWFIYGSFSVHGSHAHLPEKEAEIPVMDSNGNGSLSNVLTELSSLKERDKSMETELKELQERYSEMSLKFAEVEGERQKLVMTVRSLKNARKG
jgi:hypothetical protein